MYKNPDFKDKYYYAYITDIKFINPDMTEIKIKTDVFQTWQFDFIYKECFVEREHVNNDSVGLHTIPEGLETGEFIVNKREKFSGLTRLVYLVNAKRNLAGVTCAGTQLARYLLPSECIMLVRHLQVL
jgi:hypothetical protein